MYKPSRCLRGPRVSRQKERKCQLKSDPSTSNAWALGGGEDTAGLAREPVLAAEVRGGVGCRAPTYQVLDGQLVFGDGRVVLLGHAVVGAQLKGHLAQQLGVGKE